MHCTALTVLHKRYLGKRQTSPLWCKEVWGRALSYHVPYCHRNGAVNLGFLCRIGQDHLQACEYHLHACQIREGLAKTIHIYVVTVCVRYTVELLGNLYCTVIYGVYVDGCGQPKR